MWDLFPWDAAEKIVDVLNFGANKYTNYLKPGELYDIIGIQCNCELRTVIDGGSTTLEECAETAMRENLGAEILDSQRGKEKTAGAGCQPTERKSESTTPSMEDASHHIERHSLQEGVGLSRLDLPLKMKTECSQSRETPAESAAMVQEEDGGIWTTTTRQGRFVASFVDDATRALGCLGILSKVLEKHSPICNVNNMRLEVINDKIAISGRRNWEQGLKWSRCYGALLRHITTWFMCKVTGKPDKDPETGISHLGHAGCCLLFLLAYETRGMEKFDDRPVFPPIALK